MGNSKSVWPPTWKPGKVREFEIGQGNVREITKKVMEIVVCLWCATAVAIVAT